MKYYSINGNIDGNQYSFTCKKNPEKILSKSITGSIYLLDTGSSLCKKVASLPNYLMSANSISTDDLFKKYFSKNLYDNLEIFNVKEYTEYEEACLRT